MSGAEPRQDNAARDVDGCSVQAPVGRWLIAAVPRLKADAPGAERLLEQAALLEIPRACAPTGDQKVSSQRLTNVSAACCQADGGSQSSENQWLAGGSQPERRGHAPSSSMPIAVAELPERCRQAAAGLGEIVHAVAALHIGDRVLPALVAQAAATPPAQAGGLHTQPVASTAEGAGIGVLTAARAGHTLEVRVAADQFEEINPLFEGTDIDGHAASLAGDHLNDAQMDR
jgi:hypothetical protein